MKLQNRNLKPNDRGDDVKLLQDELRKLGFTIRDPDGFFGSGTALAVRELQQQNGVAEANGFVGRRTIDLLNKLVDGKEVERHTVLGRITGHDGEPVEGARVAVFAKGLRIEKRLAEAGVSDDGDYVVEYTLPRGRTAIMVRAFDLSGTEIAVSATIFAPALVEHADLAPEGVPRQLPESTRIARAVQAELEAENLTAADLVDTDTAFLASQTTLDKQQIDRFVRALRVSGEIEAPPSILYGLFGQNIPDQIPALLRQRPEVLRSALERAVQENQISAKELDNVESFLARLREVAVQQSFVRPEAEGTFSLRDLLETASVSKGNQEVVLRQYLVHEGTPENFWEKLRRDGVIPDKTIENFQFTLQLGALTNNHVPLVRALQNKHKPGSLRDLVKLDRAAWLDLIRGSEKAGTPPGLPGETAAEREEIYATVLAATVEESFPTPFLAARLANTTGTPFTGQGDVAEFLDNNPDFVFEKTRIERYLEERGASAVTGIANVETLKQNLKAIGRIFPIAGRTNRHEVVQPLLEQGFTSALAIERTGSAFVGRFKGILGDLRARAVFNAARHQAALVQTLFAQFSPALHGIMPQAIAPLSTQWLEFLPNLPDIPDWKSLFGTTDVCACKHCASIIGPAAYLVDLLAFVKNQGALETLLAVGRRPDLGEIELTCRNTDTPLPYIDLVNEILEQAVAPTAGVPQTTATAEELRAQPEHRNDAAYATLEQAVYPWALPFSLLAEEARAYLSHLGTPRHELMETFRPEGSGLEPSPETVAADHLSLTPVERHIITGAPLTPPRTLPSFWGLPDLSLNQLRSRLVRPRNFLNQAQLSYAEAVELFATRFISQGAHVTIDFEDDGCDLDRALIVPQPSQSLLGRVHRFERLRRKLGWSFYDLDRAVAVLSPGIIDDSLLVDLSDLRRIQEAVNLPLEEILSWWATLDTFDYRPQGGDRVPSLYGRVFQNPVVFDAVTLAIFALDPTGTELTAAGQPLADHLPALAAALGVRTENLLPAIDGSAMLDLATISHLYRTVSLARASRLSVRELVTMEQLTGQDPFVSPAGTRRFMQRVAALTDASITPTEVDYLLHHLEAPGTAVAPTDTIVANILGRLRADLREIHEQHQMLHDTDGTVTAEKLGLILPEVHIQQALGLIRGDAATQPFVPKAFLTIHLAFLDTAAALETLVGTDIEPPTLNPATQTAERFAFVLEPLIAHLRRVLGETLVIQTFASEYDLPAGSLVFVLGDDLTSFLDDAFVDGSAGLTPAAFPDQFRTTHRLSKTATIISKLGLTHEDVSWFIENGPRLGLLDLRAVPDVTPGPGELPNLYAAFEKLIEIVSLRNAFPVGEPGLFDLLEEALAFDSAVDPAVATKLFLKGLHRLTGWETGSLAFLAGQNGLALTFPDDYRSGHAVRRFLACFDVLQRLGLASPHVVPSWIAAEVTADAARTIRAAAKAKHDHAQWLEVTRAINDRLRERQRDALVAHLVASPKFKDATELYDHFLIDPEMSACQLTSRIKQAISSVQLFVFRGLLNLEPEWAISAESADEWRWMKHYRVWEANRKVFLYPENWIEPELRDEKTPLFRDFESALLQGDITARLLENAVTAYVTSLAEIARPEIAGIYRDRVLPEVQEVGSSIHGDTNTHHVFARTREIPHVYYHRRWIRSRRWTPWERVELDIEGQHLVPIKIGSRFYLFWPVFLEKVEPQTDEDDEPQKFYEIRLAWSEWQGGKWSSKKLSEDALVVAKTVVEVHSFFFRAVRKIIGGTSGGGGDVPFFSVNSVSRPEIRVKMLQESWTSIELGAFNLGTDGRLAATPVIGETEKPELKPGGLFT